MLHEALGLTQVQCRSIETAHCSPRATAPQDNACGHWDAYSTTNVPLSDLSCNKFCYIDKDSRT
jgi:hypothetical protein